MGENKKKYLTKSDYEKFDFTDTRHYGVFCSGKKGNLTVKIDPKRFQYATRHDLKTKQLEIINKRQTHYFYPAKNDYFDYHCNKFESQMNQIQDYWKKHFKPLIEHAQKAVKKPEEITPGDYYASGGGALEPDEVMIWANHENIINNWKYNQECAMVVASLYAQFIHHMASTIESVTVAVLTIEKSIGNHFDRNTLYGTAVKTGKSIQDLPSFCFYERLYSLWNFIKHNSQSTYDKLKICFPEAIFTDREYRQGDLATCIICFSDDMILSLINGVSMFFKEYCELVFEENFEEAQWNYNRFFMDIVSDEIEMFTNPLCIPYYL